MSEQSSGAYGFLEKYLMNPLGKMSQTKFVRAIMATGIAVIPFTIVGSMFLVFNILPLAIPPLEGFFNATFANFSDLYMLANTATMGMLAIYFCAVLGYELTKVYVDDDGVDLSPLNGALLSLFAFFMTVPKLIWSDGAMSRVTDLTEGATIVSGWAMGGDGVNRFGTVGIFTGIIMAIIAVQIYRLCIIKNWTIKMPEAVPAGVSRSFTALIPTFVIAFVVIILNGILVFMGTDIFDLIQMPFGFVTEITGTYIGVLVIVFLIHALWSVGIHGATIITSLVTPIMLTNMAANIDGAVMPLAGEFWNAYGWPGGSGATLGLTFFIAFMAKSEQLKVLGRTAVVPALFNINEPIIFGVPMIYNPTLLIPFLLAPMAGASVGYWATRLELVKPIIALSPWPMPVGINAFISTGDWKAIFVALASVLVAFLVYLPFIRKYDAQLLKQEQETLAAATNTTEVEDDDFFAL